MLKVLVISGDYWHPTEIVRRGLEELPDAADFDFDFITDAKDILYPEMLDEYDVIVNAKMDTVHEGNQHEWFQPEVTEVTPDVLRGWIARGHGFLALHGGSAFYKEDTSGYVQLIGSCFVQHPNRCEIRMTIDAQHPVTEGVHDFIYRDEHYELAPLADDLTVLATSHSPSGGDQLGAYVRQIGEGRLCMLAPGHILQTFRNPDFRRMISNAIRWCAGC